MCVHTKQNKFTSFIVISLSAGCEHHLLMRNA
eukprot:COSAG02_NODE_23257_length_724_cov_2.957473_1_plen_31_part_01